jgi:ABC-2 type transport system permease protein
MRETLKIARKELDAYFASPAALLFLGGFLAVVLFLFFWVDAFFARNIADVRPLFEWMPVLMIFLTAAATMRAWSEERRSGTLESLLTSPVAPIELVLGKFIAVMALVAIALVMTLPLPLSVALIGDIDWGTVVGGYVATPFLAAAYIAIGLYMSARTDNPIVALILSCVVCGAFYLVGSPLLTTLAGTDLGGLLAHMGTGTRFESITRGVLDLRDLYYYISIVGIFLTLNVYALERLRWAGNPATRAHRLLGWTVVLAAANFIAGNIWLAPVTALRADITAGHIYSLSDATRSYLADLQEPLLIRGYFSARTHPLLAPLVPQLRDLLTEYAIAGHGKVRVEFVDPQDNPAIAEEAAARYGVRPVPLETANRYQASVVNAYFDIVIGYGDQTQTLTFRDLIEVKGRGENSLQVVLKNPEYEITRAIRKALDTYRSGGNPFEALAKPVHFIGYMTPAAELPGVLQSIRTELDAALKDLQQQAGDKLAVSFEDPEANGGTLGVELARKYGLKPQFASLVDTKPFWFYMQLQGDRGTVPIPLPAQPTKDGIERALRAAVQRLAPGFEKTIALVEPRPNPATQEERPGPSFQQLRQTLSGNAQITSTDLHDGRVPADADVLMVLAPSNLEPKQVFAIDQFLMRGGSVVVTTSPYAVSLGEGLDAAKKKSGLEDWLAFEGLRIDDTMVLDRQNAALPVPVERTLGGMPVRELEMVPYPHFPDVRGAGLDATNPITASLGQVTVNWASPIEVDADKTKGRKVDLLMRSSPASWTSADLNLVPDFDAFPTDGFPVKGPRGPQTLALVLEGHFDSFFKGQPSPLTPAQPVSAADVAKAEAPPQPGKPPTPPPDTSAPASGQIEQSPESARIILVASDTFATDTAIQLASQGAGTLYTKPVEFVQNAIDYALEDRSLLAIRGRSQFARTLEPVGGATQRVIEYVDYGLALAALGLVWWWRRRQHGAAQVRYQRLLAEV